MADANTFRLSVMKDYIKKVMPAEMQEFVSCGNLKSGYKNLDMVTNLYPGLYVLGAISSLGKTTFVHQLCDQLAEAGHKVLFFSLEQSTLELATKSLSRIMARKDASKAMTSLQIRKHGTDPRVLNATDVYATYADNMMIAECTYKATINTIEQTVESYIAKTGKKPVVVVDYLQVIRPPEDSRMSSKDLIDMYVQRLKQLQSANKLVLIVISSLNRQNYLTQIDFESFKESGGIEYTADVVWGLQLEVLHDSIFNSQAKVNEKRQKVKEAKAANPRRIELVCLKNRFGISSYSCMFDYYPQFDFFRPVMDGIDSKILDTADVDQDGFVSIPEGFELPFG